MRTPMVRLAPRMAGADAQPWLAALQSLRAAPDEAIGLMLDLPFCAWRCLYCQKDIESGWNLASMQAYVDALVRQIEQVFAQLDGQHPVALVDFGGGSPNHLQMPLLARQIGRASCRERV